MKKPSDSSAANSASAKSATPAHFDAATISHVARILATLKPGLHADTAIRDYFAYWTRLGPREKRAITRATFVYFRWLQWLDHKTSAQKQIADAIDIQNRFDANPASIKTEALAALAIPEWARDEVAYPAETLRMLQCEPVLWLRAQTSAIATLPKLLGDCEPASTAAPALPAPAPAALRYKGREDLFRTASFHNGLFEIQDIASQLVGQACSPAPGQTWWDACAGEGGKTLHLADLMQNKGMLWASDRSFRRLQALKRRTARAKVFNYRAAPWEGTEKLPTKTKFDGVLLDAPCSGVGTWQRNPHARWTTSTNDVRELAAVQASLLKNVSVSLKPGGRLVYAVCTLTRSETTAVADAFTAAHPEFEPAPAFLTPANAAATTTPAHAQITLWPHQVNGNGMFIAAWRKK